jgi:hypothetical protein
LLLQERRLLVRGLVGRGDADSRAFFVLRRVGRSGECRRRRGWG